ncbi:hypothetical protein [Sphingomonas jaspsi]|uniref:hypothetical protein n=1 Tax=Sphingomonas jaspsi TaxID=392409 RepID=UPI0012ECA693|nr:hypothetical protein [Sphingomonas jaspsi]
MASEANATQYAWCKITGLGHVDMVTGVIEIGEETEDFTALDSGQWPVEFAEAFVAPNGDRPQIQGCSRENSMKLVEENWQKEEYWAREGGYKFVRTGWLGGKPAAVDRGDPDKRPERGLVFATPGSSGPSMPAVGNSAAAIANRAKDDAAILEAQKDAAAVNARRVADAARNQADTLRKLAKFMQELGQRGSAQ